MFPFLRQFFNIFYPSHIKLEHKSIARFYLLTAEPLAPYLVTTFLILHLCNCVYLSLFLYLSHVNGAEWNKSSCLVLSCPLHNGRLGDRSVAYAASVSARVRRESWAEQKKKNSNDGHDFFFCSRSNFRAMTRLETLATQANRSGEVTVSGGSTVFIYLFTYLFIYLSCHSFINSWRIVHSTGVYFPYKEVWRWIIRYLDHNFFLFFWTISKYPFTKS